ERALFALERDKGIPVTTLRPAFIYGPHNAFYREAFFWDRLLAGRPIVIPDDGTATMQWVSVTDVARAAILAGETKGTAGRAYNLAEYPPITQLDFVRLMARAAGTEATFAHIPRERIAALGGGLMAPPFYFGVFLDIPAITVSADRARKELGLELTPLEDGMRATFQWYKEQQRAPADFTWDDKALSDAQ
ncbi:MAG: NAD-dependent epimerase/dehydratase family protein, partial [Gemmatimonadaceae bacterium]